MLLRVTLMLRIWQPITWLLCLLLSPVLLLPTQHQNLAARASLAYFVSVSRNRSLQWLCNRRPRAVSVAPFIIFFRPSAPAGRVVHLSASQEPPPTNANFSNRCKHQGSLAFPGSPFHTAYCFPLPLRLRTSSQHTVPTQKACVHIGPLPLEVATRCCVYSVAHANNHSADLLTRAAQRKRRSHSISTAAEQPQRLRKKFSLYFVCSCARRSIASTVSRPTEAFADTHSTHYIPPISPNHVGALRTITPSLSNTRHGVFQKLRCTGGVRKSYYCLKLGSGCALACVTPAYSTARGDTSALGVHLDDRAADFYSPRRKTKYEWRRCTRRLRIPFPKKSGERLLFLSTDGAAAVSLGGAAAAAAINSPSATKSPAPRPSFASAGGGAAAVEGSATGNRRPLSAAAARGILAAWSAVRHRPSLSSNAPTRVIPGVALGAPAAFSPPAAAALVVSVAGGPAAGALTMPMSLAAAEAREASPAALGTSTSRTAQFLSSSASLSPLEPASYPFTSIEEKWVRYYAEHSGDFSPPLPASERVDDKCVFAEDQFRLSSSPPTVASRCVTGSYLRSDEFASETSQARESCEMPWALADPLSKPVSTKLTQVDASDAHLSTKPCESLHLPSRHIRKAAHVAATSAVPPKHHVNEAHRMVGLNRGCSACSAEVTGSAETHREPATETSPLDPQRFVEVRAVARRTHGGHGQHNTVESVQHVEITGATTDAGYRTPCSQKQGFAERVDTQEQRPGNLKQANTDAEERKREQKSFIPCTAAELRKCKAAFFPNTKKESETRAAAPAAGEQKRRKYYVLSMIPYPSGEGLHLGHCLTYTVADVVARYKRLQLRGELMRSQKSRNGGKMTNVDREEENVEGAQHQIQQQRHQEDQEEEMQFNLQKESSASELLSTRGTNVVVEKLTSEENALTYDSNLGQGSCEQARREVQEKDEALSSRTPMQAVSAPVTDGATAREDSRPTGLGRPAQTGGQKEAGSMLKQRQEEKQQVIPRASQQPDVMHVMGWDAFGLPAEQHALASGIPPRLSVRKNIERFRHQLQRLGLSVDWRREIDTSDPKYFRWTQWIFLQMWKRGLVYEKAASVNWCDALGTVLANEEVVDGVSTRGQHPVEKKRLKQWHLRITAYADELEKSLASLDWPEDVKVMQRNWIGKRELLYVNLPLLRPSMADGKGLLARESRSADGQAAPEPTVQAADESRICSSSPRKTSYARDFSRTANASSQNDGMNYQNTFMPSRAGHGGCDAAAPCTTDHEGGTPFSEKVDRYPYSLRCVSISPEFLFGVTYIVMHVAHEQAHAVAVTSAARTWLSAQNRDPTVRQDRHPASVSHVEANELAARAQKSTSTTKQTATSVTEAAILTKTQGEAAVGDQYEEAVAENNDGVHVFKISDAFFEKESAFSGSWVRHPLSGTALPVWLFSGKLFDKLRGAGTYFLERDAVLVVPEQDRVAEAFARAAGLPIISVFRSGADKKGASDVKSRKAGGTEMVRQPDKHHMFSNEKGEAIERPVQGVIINSQSADVHVNGLSRTRARRQILAHLLARNIAEQQSLFALRDWVFSRQRFWGEPIPLIRAYAEDGTASVLAESEARLPVILPEKLYSRRLGIRKRYRSSSDEVPPAGFSLVEHKRSKNVWHGEKELHFSATGSISAEGDRQRYLQHESLMAPLAGYPEWWNLAPGTISNTTSAVVRPSQPNGEDTAGVATETETDKTEKTRRIVKLQREVSTMPQWAGSSWYFLRFLDPHNTHDAFDKESARYWMPVDLYVGGKEHAVTHLLYARFWHKVLRDIGLVTCGEPFKRLCTPGIMLGTPQYVAFQRLDTGEWVSASNVSLKKGNFLEAHVSQEARKSNGAARQGVMPEIAHSTTNFEIARPLSVEPDHHDGVFSTAQSVVDTTAPTARTIRETGGESDGTGLKSTLQQDTVAGMHCPSGQPVREVEIESAAITRVKGSDAPVLKEDEKIQVVCRHEKMSKSRGNVISPDCLIHAYGADALRLHLLFMGPVEARKVWSVDGIKGVSRFLNRVWHLVSGSKTGVPQMGRGAPVPQKDNSSFLPDVAPAVGEDELLKTKFRCNDSTTYSAECTRGHEHPSTAHSENSAAADCPGEERAGSFLHKNGNCSQLQNAKLSAFENTLLKQLIERVTRHIERLTFNRAVAALMSAVKKLNQWNLEGNALSVHAAIILVKLLHPFAPFITEELWFRIHERFPDVSRYATSPSLLACGVWPTNRDLEINTQGSANDELNTAGEWGPHVEAAAGTEPAVDVSVYFDGKLHAKVQVPVALVKDKSTLEEYVKRDTQVAKFYQDKRILRSVVLLKAKLVNFVTTRINCSDDRRKKWN